MSSPAQTLQVIYLQLTCDWTFELLAMAIAILFQHAEHFTCDPLISQSIVIQFSNGFHH